MKTTRIKIVGKGSAVYLLKRKGMVVYVGQSGDVLGRFVGHRNKKYDEVEIFWCNKKELRKREKQLIEKYKPSLNVEISGISSCGYLVRLTRTNLANLDRFIAESKNVEPEYNVSPTAIVNMMFGEKLREELKRFYKKNPDWENALYGIEFKTMGKPINVGQPPKRFKRKKP